MFSRLLLFVLICIATAGVAQEAAIQHIRQHYQQIAKEIEDCNYQADTCRLYNDILTLNAGKSPWRAVGIYSREAVFYYHDDPNLCDDCPEGGINVLQRVDVFELVSLHNYQEQFLFEKGRLLFYYLAHRVDGDGADPLLEKEYRYYFDEDDVVRYMEGQQILPSPPPEALEIIQSKAARYRQLFLLAHE